jgi:tRNA dimethylallyltransferase
MTESEAIAETQALTRRYARRQVSWFKRYDDLEWLAAGDAANATQVVSRVIADRS